MIKKLLKRALGIDKIGSYLREDSEKAKVLCAQPMVRWIKEHASKLDNIQDAEFSAFSQWGDDGIIQYLIHTLELTNKTFIEFGVSNYVESNTRFLLLNDNWKGLVIDGSESNVNFIRNDSISWKYSITSTHSFITKDNINTLIADAGFEGEIGILHIDVDGNDYWFWETIDQVDPIIVIMEYNSVFGNKGAISVPYKHDFFVTREHHSNLYFGASLKAMDYLASKKGYSLVGSNSNGNNAYFIRNDKLRGIRKVTVDEAYVQCNFRQNRDKNGSFTFIDDLKMIKECSELTVIDVINTSQSRLGNYL